MDNNQKHFGVYVFLSTFSRNLVEVFIPVILYKFGFCIKEIILYYFFVNLLSLILSYPCVWLLNKINNKLLSIIGIISFACLQIMLNFMIKNIYYLMLVAFLFAVYRRGYWISRRFYNLNVIKKEKISTTYAIISIINQTGKIFSAYIGALLLDFVSLKILTIISVVLFFISIIPLSKIECDNSQKKSKIEFIKNIKRIPKSNLFLFGTYELHNVIEFLFTLYIFIYVKNKYQTIGMVNLINNLAILVFTYKYGKTLDYTKKNFLRLSIILVISIYILKANSLFFVLLIVSFFEGFAIKMHELSINNEFFKISKNFDYSNYNLIYEITQNVFRTLATLMILVIPGITLKNMIYIILGFVFIGCLLKMKPIKNIE